MNIFVYESCKNITERHHDREKCIKLWTNFECVGVDEIFSASLVYVIVGKIRKHLHIHFPKLEHHRLMHENFSFLHLNSLDDVAYVKMIWFIIFEKYFNPFLIRYLKLEKFFFQTFDNV